MRGKKQATTKKSSAGDRRIAAVDLFCGVGGLTRGLEKAGIDVRLGVDVDPYCEYPYSANNRATFLLQSVADVTSAGLNEIVANAPFSLLAGCAPCQPFSTYQQKLGPTDGRWNLLGHFGQLAAQMKPDLVTMENVPNLAKQSIFAKFVQTLERSGFHVSHQVVNCADYGVPQQRNRLVLLASRLGPIAMSAPSSARKRKTVREAIGSLTPIEAGGVCPSDPLHQASELSVLNLKRIKASKPGGSWRDWDKALIADCHKKSTGKSYPSVYGRMVWDEPAPTMTTQFYGFGNGRFGHPEQDRAISLREGAILQSFPKGYKFVPKNEPVYFQPIGRLVGNAVPVKLAEAIGKSIVRHINEYAERTDRAA